MGFIDKKETKVAQSLRNENSIKGWKCILESVEHYPLDASYSAKSWKKANLPSIKDENQRFLLNQAHIVYINMYRTL